MLIPEDFAQINFIFNGAGVPTGAQITMGVWLNPFAGSPEDLADLAAAAWIGSQWSLFLTSDVDLQEILVKFGPNETGPSFLRPSVDGGAQSGAATPQVAYLVHKETNLGGRAGAGRFYLPGVAEGFVGPGGAVDGSQIDDLQLCADTFIGWMDDGDAPLALLHAEGSPITSPTPITALSVDSTAATQRRRQRR